MTEIRIDGGECLRPRLLAADGRAACRVEGVLAGASGAEGVGARPRLVDRVVFDGERCRYRILGAAPGDRRWIDERRGGEYRPYAPLIVDRVCRAAREGWPALHRFPGGPPSRALARRVARLGLPDTIAVRDALVTARGTVWLRVELLGTGAGWRPLARTGDALAGGWSPLRAIGTGHEGSAVGEPESRAQPSAPTATSRFPSGSPRAASVGPSSSVASSCSTTAGPAIVASIGSRSRR